MSMDEKLSAYLTNIEKYTFDHMTYDYVPPLKLDNTTDRRIVFKNKNDSMFTKAFNYVRQNMHNNTDESSVRTILYEWFILILEELFTAHFNENIVIEQYMAYHGIDKKMFNPDILIRSAIKSKDFIDDDDDDDDTSKVNVETKPLKLSDVKGVIDENIVVRLLALAFTPAASSIHANSEILEFNGDKIINKSIASYLVNLIPINESRLTNTVFKYTDKKFFSEIAYIMGIDKFLGWNMYLNSESKSEDAFEAFIKVLDIISTMLNSKLILMGTYANFHFNLVDMLQTYIFSKIVIQDVIKPDSTFLTELFIHCSPSKERLKEHIKYTKPSEKSRTRSTHFWFTCSEEAVASIVKKTYINPAFTDKLYTLFTRKYILVYVEPKIAKAIVSCHIVNELKKYGLDVIKFTNIKSEFILRRMIGTFCRDDLRPTTYNIAKEIIRAVLQNRDFYIDVVDGKTCADTELKIKILPVDGANVKLHIQETIILERGVKSDLLTNLLTSVQNKIKSMSNS